MDGWMGALMDRQTDRQTRTTHCLSGRQADRQTGRQTGRQADRQTGRQADRQTGRQAGRQAGRQTGRQTDRQTRRHADGHTDTTDCLSGLRLAELRGVGALAVAPRLPSARRRPARHVGRPLPRPGQPVRRHGRQPARLPQRAADVRDGGRRARVRPAGAVPRRPEGGARPHRPLPAGRLRYGTRRHRAAEGGDAAGQWW